MKRATSKGPRRCAAVFCVSTLLYLSVSAVPPVVASSDPIHDNEAARESGGAETVGAPFPELPPMAAGQTWFEQMGHDVTQSSTRARADELAATAKESEDPAVRIEYLLASSDLTFSSELAPFCTAAFLRVPQSADEAALLKDADDVIQRAGARLEEALRELDDWGKVIGRESSEPSDDSSEVANPAENKVSNKSTRYRMLASRAHTLRAFSDAQTAFLQIEFGAKIGEESIRMAASGLATLLEDDDEQVAAAARFWQSLLRSHEPEPDAVLSRLAYVSSDDTQGAMPFLLYERLLRCRVVARHYTPATALALNWQLEEHCYDWFEEKLKRERAIRTIIWTRLELLRLWYDALDPDKNRSERAWCAAQARSLIDDHLSGADRSVLGLAPCLPTLIPDPFLRGQADRGAP